MKTGIFFLSLFAALLVSCEKKAEIKVYRVSKAPLEETASQQQEAMRTLKELQTAQAKAEHSLFATFLGMPEQIAT